MDSQKHLARGLLAVGVLFGAAMLSGACGGVGSFLAAPGAGVQAPEPSSRLTEATNRVTFDKPQSLIPPDSTLTGTHSGGGMISLTTSTDGKAIVKFAYTELTATGDRVTCKQDGNSSYSNGLAVSDSGDFVIERKDVTVKGTFIGDGEVRGTLTWRPSAQEPVGRGLAGVPVLSPCDDVTVSWQARPS